MSPMTNTTFNTYPDSIATRYTVSVLASWASELCTYPIDLTKTRLQIQGEVAAAKHGLKIQNRGMVNTIAGIVKEEGALKLWSGLTPMLQRHLIYSGCRLVFYENLRDLFKDKNGHISFTMATVSGVSAGALAQLIASPTDLIKVQMQAEGRRRLQGLPPRILSSAQAYTLNYRESGVIGLWRGALPNVQRAALVNFGDLVTYDLTKQIIIEKYGVKDGLVLQSVAAAAAGVNAAVISTPADVLKTRLMNQPVGQDGKGLLYRGMIDCVIQSVRNEGVMSLYKGFIPVWLRVGPWAFVYWLAFESVMKQLGGHPF